MNFFDYDLTRQATATPPVSAADTSDAASQPTLNEEMTEVVGQLGRLWGGFRKQSQTAFETARKDLSSVVAQAQKEIEKLSTETVAGPSGSNTEATSRSVEDTSEVATPKGSEETLPQSPSTSASASTSSTAGLPAFQFQSILSKVQSALPPNLSQTLENTIPAALKDPHVDLASFRASLGAEFARVQGVTRAQAEEYAHKSEALLREAGEYLKEAVKVLPPEEGSDSPEVMVDPMGLGVVMVQPNIGSSGRGMRSGGRASGAGGGGKGKGREMAAQQALAGSRAAAMVAKLKRDKGILRQDPRADATTKEAFESWYKDEVENKPGGITSDSWVEKTKAILEEEDSAALKETRDSLVASDLDPETFWTHFFFRLYQIEKDEDKRKALLAASGDGTTDEDFDWDDDEDEDDESAGEPESVEADDDTKPARLNTASGTLQKRSSCDTLQPGGEKGHAAAGSASYPESLVNSPSFTGSRASSEGYDVVSSGHGSGAETKKAATEVQKKEVAKVAKNKDDRKEEDDEEEEEEGDSDWE